MKLSKEPSRVFALLCIVQVCLLSLASVSPQIHVWAFHGEQLSNKACSGAHSTCSKAPQTSDEQEPSPTAPNDSGGFCPVLLFAEGVVLEGNSAIWLPEQLAVVASIEAESDTVWTNCSKGRVQARAPPVV